jgi:phosphatidylinositol alpha-1,6-mannosyltransferase
VDYLCRTGAQVSEGHPWPVRNYPTVPVLLTNEPTNDYGGIQRYVARLATGLAARGHAVTLIEPKGASPTDWPAVRIVRFPSAGRLLSLLLSWAAYVRVANDPRDITIASIWFPSGLVAAVTSLCRRRRLAILAHGSEISPSRGGLRRMLMRWTFERADVVIANSSYTHQLLRASGVSVNTKVVPCGVDSRDVRRRPSMEPRVLIVGRLIQRKGFDRMIEAMPEILRAVPDARLRIVGDGPLRPALEAMATGLSVLSHVDFLGALSDSDLDSEYEEAWCFAMPCRRIGDDVEGFGIVYLEAAIAGLPSIGGSDSGAADAIDDGVTGSLVDGRQVPQIAAAVISYLRDVKLSSEVGERARSRALSEFTWSKVAAMIEAAIE